MNKQSAHNNERKCIECGLPLIKRKHESEARFQAKKFDKASCSRAYMKRNKLGWWSPESMKNRPLDSYI